MLQKVLEHSDKKYTIITGLWKVYAVLLEYCCKLDYKMIIATLNIEKKEELEELEKNYKNQLVYFEENQRALEQSLEEAREQLRKFQRKLDLEIQRKEELEDELMQKGSGHEEEVNTRIKFESKVNQMYAKQRDMETRTGNLQEVIEEMKKNLEIKTVLLNKEKKTVEDVITARDKSENECRRLDEKYKQCELTRIALDSRLNEAYLKIEDLSKAVSIANANYAEAINEITQKKIEVEDKKYEIEIKLSNIQKLEKMIEELKSEKSVFHKRTIELEILYNDECDKNQHYKQEYARIKESDNFYAVEYMKYKEKSDDLEKRCEDIKDEKSKLKIQLESIIQGYEEYKIQVKKAQERIEEMNKGRRVIEEQNEYLNRLLSEKNEELKDSRNMNLELKDDMERMKTRESTLESEITTLSIKLRSIEKQYEANKETMQQKINSLSDIINSEKKIRENWITKFEEEQKNHSISSRTLITAQDTQNELTMKLNTAILALDEKTQRLNIQLAKNSEQLEEILELKALQGEATRKNKTLQMLYDNSERERLNMIKSHAAEIEYLNEMNKESCEKLKMRIEEIMFWAHLNLVLYDNKTADYNDLYSRHNDLIDLQNRTAGQLERTIEQWNRLSMYIQELEMFTYEKLQILDDLTYKYTKITGEYEDLYKTHTEFMNLVPVELKDTQNPFQVLQEKIDELSGTLQEIEFYKSNMVDFEVQYDTLIITFDENTQTDIGFSFFEKNRRMSSSGTPHSGSQRVYSAKSKEAPGVIAEYPQKRKNDQMHPQSSESALREETPINMTSVYHQ